MRAAGRLLHQVEVGQGDAFIGVGAVLEFVDVHPFVGRVRTLRIAGADFHQEQKGFELDTFQTIFLVDDRRSPAVLQALERGRFYAVQKSKNSRLSLDQFKISDNSSGKAAIMGEEIDVAGTPILAGRISTLDRIRQDVAISIIRGGQLKWTFEGQTPLDFHLVDQDGWHGKSFYRLDVQSTTGGHLLSNPIFVIRNNG